jgi:hypothetical protein
VLPLPRGEGRVRGNLAFLTFHTPHSALERGEFTLSPHFVAHFVDPVSPLLHHSKTPFSQISRSFHHVRSFEPQNNSILWDARMIVVKEVGIGESR